MKRFVLKSIFFRLLPILIFTMLLNGCSKDDNNGTSFSNTLLVSLDGSVWKVSEASPDYSVGFTMLLRFKNDLKEPFQFWINLDSYNNPVCYFYMNSGLHSKTVDVIENSKDIFKVRMDLDGLGSYSTYTFTKSGETIIFKLIEEERIGSIEYYNFILVKSSVNVVSLTICN